MPYQAPPNRAYGTLGAVYASGGATLTLQSGHGARFGALPAGSWFWVLIEDKNETVWNRFMIAKVTAIAGDSLAITPAEDGTSNSNFPITGGNPIQKVQVYAGHSVRQLRAMMDGFGAIIQAAAPTLTVDSPRTLILAPAFPFTQALPTTGVWAGMCWTVVNKGASPNAITVTSSDGSVVGCVLAGTSQEFCAYKDTPTTTGDWGPRTMAVKFAAGDSGSALVSTSSQAVGAILTLPANALNANGRAYRATFFIDSNNSTNDLTAQIRFNGTVLLSLQDFSSAQALCISLTIVRVSATQYVVGLNATAMNINFYGGSGAGVLASGTPVNLQTVANWTSAINFDVNVSEWTSGTIRSMITGEQIG